MGRSWAGRSTGAIEVWRRAHYLSGGTSANQRPELFERWLGGILITLSVLLAGRIEKRRRLTVEPPLERAGAYALVAGLSFLALLARRIVQDRASFLARLHEARRSLLSQRLPADVPLVVIGMLNCGPGSPVVHTTCDNFSLLYALSGTEVRFIVSCYWVKFQVHFLWHRALRLSIDPFDPTDRVRWLANTLTEVEAARRAGVVTPFVNHNCFVNEDAFSIDEAPGKERFSAVLNANAGRWKRHELARDVTRLAYVTYSRDASGALEWPVKHFAPAFRNKHYLDEVERSRLYGAADCGLVLSACEGSNYSTIEHLLCGLPVVSTPSIGGRDVWFTPRNSTVCAATPEAVGAAVTAWSSRRLTACVDRVRIRREAIDQMKEHRARFVGVLQDLLDEAGARSSADRIFEDERRADRMIHALSFQRANSPHAHPHCQGKAWYRLDALPFGVGGQDKRENGLSMTGANG